MTQFHDPICEGPSPLTRRSSDDILIHAKAEDLPAVPAASFTRLPGDDRIFAFVCGFPAKDTEASIVASDDGGKTWTPTGPFMSDMKLLPSDSGVFIGTSNGTLIAAFSNVAEKANWDWDKKLMDSPGATLPLYVTRSVDAGKTWAKPTKLHDAWTGASRDVIETHDGRIVFATMKLLHNPGRHTVMTYSSDDDGKTWTPSNIIDLGGAGHHGGVSEATLVELKDGRLLKYLRTPWGCFWRALSSDGGRHWHPFGPTCIDASSAPAFLRRLQSGRIAMAWNREHPEGTKDGPFRGGDGDWSSTAASVYRNELSLSFSDDECQTWTAPVVVARNESGEVSYPSIFEPEPGLLWITTHRWKLRIQLREADFVR